MKNIHMRPAVAAAAVAVNANAGAVSRICTVRCLLAAVPKHNTQHIIHNMTEKKRQYP